MANITHKIGGPTDVGAVIAALTTLDGLKNWWTTETTGDPQRGGVIEFRFNGEGFDMKVEGLSRTEVIWRCISGPPEWLETTIEFRVETGEEGHTAIYFAHRNWAEESPFHYHCSMKWASFLLSLKEYLETGQGRPFPDDIQIEQPLTHKAA